MDLYELNVKEGNGTQHPLSQYKGKVLLIVNTASKCGFTPQYEDLERLYKKYKSHGLQVLAFPCNQFHEQEPEDNKAIAEFCALEFGITFPVLAKLEVNGENADPLYRYLISQKGFEGFDMEHPLGTVLDSMLTREKGDYRNSNEIKWNFTKFLVDRDGSVVARFEPTADMKKVEQRIKEIL